MSVVNESYENEMPNHYKSLIIHELAHTFTLEHTGLDNELMGVLPYGFPKYITKENAAILNESPAFSVIETIETERNLVDADVNNEDATETRSQKKNADFTYLTLTYNDKSALTPSNPQREWGWSWGGWQQFWEKKPGGTLPPIPHQGFMPAKFIPYVNQWDYFFYAHHPSRIVYDLSGGNYTKFDAYFDMPNPCTHIATPASMEVIFLADNTEIYNTGVFRGDEARNTHITFDIPRGTKELTIKVTDAGDGDTCDHFIFANARLISEPVPIKDDSYDTDYTAENNTDVNADGYVNIVDLVLVAARYGEKITGNPTPNPDVNRNGIVDVSDLVLVATAIDSANSAYSAPTHPAPTETALLPNYPNPFNPETWIPYQLATDSNVTITIYDTTGTLIRSLSLGYQSAGYYIRQSRAAYWDGRNELGESVASGVYFYVLQTDADAYVKKMLVLK